VVVARTVKPSDLLLHNLFTCWHLWQEPMCRHALMREYTRLAQ